MRTLVYVAAIAMVAACNLTHPADVFPDDTLVTLTASHGVLDPPFAPELDEYDLDLVLDEADLALTPTATVVDGTTMTLDGNPITSGTASPAIGLAIGETRDVHVVVTRGGGDVRTYVLHVHRGVDGLAGLAPSKGALTPVFDPATNAYTVGLHLDQASAALTPTLLFPARASMSVNGSELMSGASTGDVALAPGVNAVAVTVTPKTRTARSYDVEVVRGIDALAGIQLSFGGALLFDPLEPMFDPGTLGYDVHTGAWLQSISLSATPLVAGTEVTIAGSPVANGVESPPFTLNAGLTTVDVAVKSNDGSTTHYQVRIYRATAGKQEAYAKGPLYLSYGLGAFGTAMYGDTVVATSINDSSAAVGVNGDPSDSSALHSGAAFVFVRDQNGWSQQAYLKASNTGREDRFGSAAAIWGDTVAVSATNESSSATGVNGDQVNNAAPYSGAVYVFRRSGATWAQEAYIKAPMVNENGNFGAAVALSGDTLAVMNVSPLAVYIYRRNGSTWSYEKSISDDGDIALWGDTLAVFNGTSLNVYLRSAGEWALQQSVTPPNPNSTYVSLALFGDTAVIGGEDGTGPAVWVFTRTSSTWSLQQTLRAPSGTPSSATFGSAVALWGDLLVIGAIGDSSNATGLNGDQSDTGAMSSGAAFVFSRNTPIGSSKPLWYFRDYVKASNTAVNAQFSQQLAAWGDTFVISAPGERGVSTGVNGDQTTNPVGTVSGALYIFR